MTGTALPRGAAGTDAVSDPDPIAAAAQAFKLSLGQIEAAQPEPGEEEEIEAEAEAEEAEAEAESREAGGEDREAAEEAQPDDLPLPKSWPSEHAETWKALPPEAQAIIAEREGQRDAAVNAKFQEAANLRKAHQAEIEAAQGNRQLYAEQAELVLSLVQPQQPPRSMLDPHSGDYDPNAYHYRKALCEDMQAFLNQHRTQLAEARAQEESARFNALNNATRESFLASVPDAADQAKAPAIIQALIDYAVSIGTPAETFQAPTTALEWHVLWKAREYDRLQEAKARVRSEPRPEPKKARPAVRPSVTTPRSAIEHQQRGQAMDRLRQSGSVQDGAAALKQLLKGNLS